MLKDQTHTKHIHEPRTTENTKNTYRILKQKPIFDYFVTNHTKSGQDKTS